MPLESFIKLSESANSVLCGLIVFSWNKQRLLEFKLNSMPGLGHLFTITFFSESLKIQQILQMEPTHPVHQ